MFSDHAVWDWRRRLVDTRVAKQGIAENRNLACKIADLVAGERYRLSPHSPGARYLLQSFARGSRQEDAQVLRKATICDVGGERTVSLRIDRAHAFDRSIVKRRGIFLWSRPISTGSNHGCATPLGARALTGCCSAFQAGQYLAVTIAHTLSRDTVRELHVHRVRSVRFDH